MTASDPHPGNPQDPLDDLLQSARWPKPTNMQRGRLEARWESLSRERSRSRRRRLRWTLAASVVLSLGLGWAGWKWLRPAEEREMIAPITQPAEPRLVDHPIPDPITFRADSRVRPPTAYERLVFQARSSRRGQSRHPVVWKDPIEKIRAWWARLDLEQRRMVWESQILRDLPKMSRVDQKRNLALLKLIGSTDAVPVLDRLSRDSRFVELAWPVALHLAPSEMLGKWAKAGSLARRAEAMDALLDRTRDPQALAVFLNLVAQPHSRALALHILARRPNPPVEALFAKLEQGTKEQRHAAGVVLGHIADPDITHRLLSLARKSAYPTEITVALLNSSDRYAVQFLKRAKSNPLFVASIQLACLEWEKISFASTLPQPWEIH